MRMDGSDRQSLVADHSSYIRVVGDYLYWVAVDYRGPYKLKRMRRDCRPMN